MNSANDYQRNKTNFKSRHTITIVRLVQITLWMSCFVDCIGNIAKLNFHDFFQITLKGCLPVLNWFYLYGIHILIDVDILNVNIYNIRKYHLCSFKGVYRGGDKGGTTPLELRAITHINDRRAFLYRLQLFSYFFCTTETFTNHNYFLDLCPFFVS